MELFHAIAFICIGEICKNEEVSKPLVFGDCVKHIAAVKDDYKKLDPFVIITCEPAK